MTEKEFTDLANKHLTVLESYQLDENGNSQFNIFGLKQLYEAITVTRCCTELPTSTQLLSDCKKRFKDLRANNYKFDYRSYLNGYLDSFSKYAVSKTK